MSTALSASDIVAVPCASQLPSTFGALLRSSRSGVELSVRMLGGIERMARDLHSLIKPTAQKMPYYISAIECNIPHGFTFQATLATRPHASLFFAGN